MNRVRLSVWILPFVLLFALVSVSACSDDAPQGRYEQHDYIKVVFLRGTPYQMGRQHAELLYDALLQGRDYVENDAMLSIMLEYAKTMKLNEVARENSYPSTLEECQGLVDGLGDAWSMDECLILNYGDVVVERLKQSGLGCSQFVATGPATADGELLHGRNLDWWKVDYIEQNPIIFVREPDGGIPWMAVGFPANMSPYTGMNLDGIAVSSNEVSSPLETEVKDSGRSHVQMVREILRSCSSLQEAEAFLQDQDHCSAETLVVSDGVEQKAAAFEMTAYSFAARRLNDDRVLWATNHFTDPSMLDAQEPQAPGTSSWNRYARLEQLLMPNPTRDATGASDVTYGELDPAAGVEILRDTYNVYTHLWEDPLDLDGAAIGSNGAMQSVVMQPGLGLMWVALGEFPSTVRKFVGFSLPGLLGDSDAVQPDPASFPALDAQ